MSGYQGLPNATFFSLLKILKPLQVTKLRKQENIYKAKPLARIKNRVAHIVTLFCSTTSWIYLVALQRSTGHNSKLKIYMLSIYILSAKLIDLAALRLSEYRLVISSPSATKCLIDDSASLSNC